MPKFNENKNCHFFPENGCKFPIPKETLEEALENWDDEENGDTLYQIPFSDEPICTNCLLSQLISKLNA